MITTVRYAAGSVLVGIAVFLLKYAAYAVTGSVALYSDAAETLINIVAAGAAVIALRVSAMPADSNHPYGHHKAEYFSAVLEGVLIVIAALAIFRNAGLAFLSPHALNAPTNGLLLNAAATVINLIWAVVLVRLGRRVKSPALSADGRHLFTDVLTSAGVIVGVILVHLTGWLWLDPAIAILIAFNILWTGWQVMRESVGGLMDESVSEDQLARIRATIFHHAQGAYQAHDLRTRHAGRRTFIEFHLVVPDSMSVVEAHHICDRLEAGIENEIADSKVTIHVEPEDKAKVSDVYLSG